MKNSSLLKWASNNKKANKEEKGGNNKNWLHSPETLKNGHVAYLVKFLGSTEVDKSKGIDVVKQGIQKLKFNQQLKKSEGQSKTPKVELTISVEGVSIQEPKTKKLLHQYPLHKISYCADDKAEKRFFSFISKEGDSDKHVCFVFVSDKLAEEITLTIGQAFELAYKKFLDTSGKDMEIQKQILTLQKRVSLLESEGGVLKSRLQDLSKFKEVKDYMAANNINDLCHVELNDTKVVAENESSKGKTEESKKDTLINLEAETGAIDGFTLDDLKDDFFNPRAGSSDDDDEFNPRANAVPSPAQAPTVPPPPSAVLTPPALPPRDKPNNDTFHSDAFFETKNPFVPASAAMDPFGMSTFDSSASQPFNDSFTKFPGNSISSGFSDGWAKTPTQLPPAINAMSLDDLDPLKK